MKEEIKIEEVIELVKSGFDWDLIAFEYDLSPKYINNCKKAYQKSIQLTNNETKEKNFKEVSAYFCITWETSAYENRKDIKITISECS